MQDNPTTMPAAYDSPDFGTLRTIDRDGDTLFCAKDAAKALGYRNASKAVGDHCKGITFRYPLPTKGGTQDMTFIGEPDLLRLIVASKLPTAQRFERWVFEEVLPSIRRRGAYLTADKVEQVLSDPDTIIRLATELKAERAEREALRAENERLAPKALFADAVASSDDLIIVRELAHILRQNGLDTGERRLYQRLREDGYVEKRRNHPTQRSLDMGLMRVVETTITKPDGTSIVRSTVKVTGKGQQYFVARYCGREA